MSYRMVVLSMGGSPLGALSIANDETFDFYLRSFGLSEGTGSIFSADSNIEFDSSTGENNHTYFRLEDIVKPSVSENTITIRIRKFFINRKGTVTSYECAD